MFSYTLAVAFSPDGTRLATGTSNQKARIWDAATGEKLLELRHNGGGVRAVAFSPDGTRLVTSGGGSARIWDAASGKELLELGAGVGVWVVEFSPDGARLVTSGHYGGTRVWDTYSGEKLLELDGGRKPELEINRFFRAGAASVNERHEQEMQSRYYAYYREKVEPELSRSGSVKTAAFSPDGTRLAIGNADDTARIWDAASGNKLRELGGTGVGAWVVTSDLRGASPDIRERLEEELHRYGYVMAVAFSPDGTWLATGSADGTARIWDAAGIGKELLKFDTGKAVWAVAFSPDGARLATCHGAYILIWSVANL